MRTAPLTHKRWSLARRLSWWVLAVMITPGVVVVVLGGVFVESSIERELHALLDEEVEEALVRVRPGDDPLAGFVLVAEELADQHPETPFGWRVSDARTGAVRGDFGDRALLNGSDAFAEVGSVATALPRRRFARSFHLSPDLRGLLVIDGHRPFQTLTQYWWLASAMLLAGGALALVASRLLAGRVRQFVRQVADDLRATHAEDAPPAARPAAPDEIRDVVDALGEEMQRIRREAERVNLFTASLAHELRSPLQNLIGQVEVALLRPRDAAAYQAVLADQLVELGELGDAVDNLVAMCAQPARIEAEPEEFDLAVEACLRLQRDAARAAREGVELHIENRGDTRMWGDREGVLRAIRNVVANAIDWTPESGQVQVVIEGSAAGLTVTTDDSGPGVPVEVRPRIFEPFVQGPRRQRRRAGYGLGLAIARAGARRHGGEIVVGESPLGGARFTLTFRRHAGADRDLDDNDMTGRSRPRPASSVGDERTVTGPATPST